ncbi:hypothetical protein [Desulfococcus sp.]|uniref:hypothetical protein n=1 Tax=Desulfococcus sp. TaxID=2025834 RepID=UPI0035941B58
MKIIRRVEGDVEHIKSILHWHHKNGGEAHCLVRIFKWITPPKAIAVISEIESNPIGLEISDDVEGMAEALSRSFGTDISSRMEGMVWVVHHGRFSFFEVLHQETFTRVDLKWRGRSAESSLSDWHLLEASEIRSILDGIDLEPVHAVLAELGWA